MRMMDWRFLLVAALLGCTLIVSHLTDRRTPDFLAESLETMPDRILDWNKASDQELDARTLSVLSPTSYLSSRYERGRENLELFVAFYAQQGAGQSMHSPKHCLPGSGWEIWKQDSVSVPVNGKSFKINEYSIQNGLNRMIVFYWYQSRDRIIASEYLGKFILMKDALLGGRTAACFVRIAVPDRPGAHEAGLQFSTRIIPEIQRCFGGKLAVVRTAGGRNVPVFASHFPPASPESSSK